MHKYSNDSLDSAKQLLFQSDWMLVILVNCYETERVMPLD